MYNMKTADSNNAFKVNTKNKGIKEKIWWVILYKCLIYLKVMFVPIYSFRYCTDIYDFLFCLNKSIYLNTIINKYFKIGI